MNAVSQRYTFSQQYVFWGKVSLLQIIDESVTDSHLFQNKYETA